MEKRVEEIIEAAREGYLGNSYHCRELFAVGFLAQSVYQLELDLKETNKKIEQLRKNLDRSVVR